MLDKSPPKNTVRSVDATRNSRRGTALVLSQTYLCTVDIFACRGNCGDPASTVHAPNQLESDIGALVAHAFWMRTEDRIGCIAHAEPCGLSADKMLVGCRARARCVVPKNCTVAKKKNLALVLRSLATELYSCENKSLDILPRRDRPRTPHKHFEELRAHRPLDACEQQVPESAAIQPTQA